jgi:hypothetical protein
MLGFCQLPNARATTITGTYKGFGGRFENGIRKNLEQSKDIKFIKDSKLELCQSG